MNIERAHTHTYTHMIFCSLAYTKTLTRRSIWGRKSFLSGSVCLKVSISFIILKLMTANRGLKSVWRKSSSNLLYWTLNHKEEISLIAAFQKWIKHQRFMDLKHAVDYCIKIIMLENWNVIIEYIYTIRNKGASLHSEAIDPSLVPQRSIQSKDV